MPNEPYAPDPNRVQWKASAEQIWSALREDRPVGAKAKKPSATPSPTGSPADRLPRRRAGARRQRRRRLGLARQAAEALEVQGFTGVTTSTGATEPPPRSSSSTPASHEEDARTVAAAFPGADGGEGRRASARTVRVTLGPDAPEVVEVPNRLGTDPLPSPSITASPTPTESIQTRKADTDICS